MNFDENNIFSGTSHDMPNENNVNDSNLQNNSESFEATPYIPAKEFTSNNIAPSNEEAPFAPNNPNNSFNQNQSFDNNNQQSYTAASQSSGNEANHQTHNFYKSDEEYRENIKRMKEDYKQFQRDQKEANKRYYSQQNSNNKASSSTSKTVILSTLISTILVSLLFAIVAFFPTPSRSFLSRIYNSTPNSTSSKFNDGQTTRPNGNDVNIDDETISKGDDVTINIQGDSAIAQAVYAKAANSVVGISVSKLSGSKWNQTKTVVSMGSGIIYSKDGIIVTNHHVVENAINTRTGDIDSSFNIQIFFNTDLSEWAYATEIIGYDAENDIAVLRVNADDLSPIEFADSDNLTTGETAISIGSPGGISYMNSISEGILSGINRTINTGTTIIYDLIQTTAAINPGNSGGALLNSQGQLIGICVIKIAAANYESMGFAINSNTVKTIVESIIEYGFYNKPLFGITVNTTYTVSIANQEGWEPGAYIDEVSPNSAADKAGIKSEEIITKIEDTKISSFAELRRYLLDCKPGDTINVTLFDSSTEKTRTVSVTLDGSTKK